MFLRKLLLWLNGLAFSATGLLGFISTRDLVEFVGYKLTSGAAHTEFVANYGGLYLFYGVYLCWCGTGFGRTRQGISVLCFTSFGLATGRAIGSMTAGVIDSAQLFFWLWEIATGLLTLGLLFKSKKH